MKNVNLENKAMPQVVEQGGILKYREALSFDAVWNSRYYFALLFALAAVYSIVNVEQGMTIIAVVLCLFLIFCNDLLASVFPILVLSMMSVVFFKKYDEMLIQYSYEIVAIIGSFLLHLARYAKPFKTGNNLIPLIMVSFATVLGGLGATTIMDVASYTSLYYIAGLGVGMLCVYIIAKAYITCDKSYDVRERYMAILYAAALFAAFMTARFYYFHLERFLEDFSVIFCKYRNTTATVMLLGLPSAFYFASKRIAHIFGAGAIMLCLMLSGSRGGSFIGAAIFVLGIVFVIYYDKEHKKRNIKAAALLAIPALVIGVELFLTLFSSRFEDGTFFVNPDDSRLRFIERAFEDYRSNMLFGLGLGNTRNGDIYTGVPGSLVFYHNWFAQIIGSMGLVGLIAYTTQLIIRLKTITDTWSKETVAMTMTFGGLFLMSMVNPGEFSPFPNEFIIVVLFAIMEEGQRRAVTGYDSEMQPHYMELAAETDAQ